MGAALVSEGVQRMRDAGETVITLNVNTSNSRAAGLYRRLGFTHAGRRARYQAGA
jgi:ribosomal protein S18 acetylase RimI-like enzyme